LFDLVFTRAEQTESRFGFSGGGAKGFAHIGVLKVLEAGLKIDYIEEQVWGLLLGLYASGYTATQIDSIFQSTNFDELIRTSKVF
jgi:NTE family protein